MTEEGSKKVKTTISSNAKQEVYEYYKFPKSIEYFDAFEDAMTHFAPDSGGSGIKKVRGQKDTLELKIKGHDDRLFAYNGTFYFNKFSNIGLH